MPLALLAGCATLHTHPLLGPAVAGRTAWNIVAQGQAYRDPEGRFAVTAPTRLAWATTADGVVFNDWRPPVGGDAHAVFAFPRPADPSGKRFALLSSAQYVQDQFARRGVRLRVLREAQGMERGRPAMELDVVLTDKWDRTPPHVAVVRLLDQPPHVYWICTARPTLGEPTITEAHRRRAEEFFAAVTFAPPASTAEATGRRPIQERE
jgi:hypothetical protein